MCRKHLNGQSATPAPTQAPAMNGAQAWKNGLVNPTDIVNPEARRWSGSTAMSNDIGANDFSAVPQHVPHSICKQWNSWNPAAATNGSDQTVNQQISKGEIHRRQSHVPSFNDDPTYNLLTSASIHGDRTSSVAPRLASPSMPPAPMLKHRLPAYLKPLPSRMTSVDIDYLFAKGALSMPDTLIRNVLLRSYIEYVHPYMPLIELHDVLQIINDPNGESGKISLLLFHAIMFAGTAFVDMEYLKIAGYSNRKSARKAFFQKARVGSAAIS
jgi:hypothetical protein